MRPLMARKLEERKLKGIPNKTAQKRARKGIHSQIVNLFKCGNMEKGQKMLDNLKKKSPCRYNYVKRMIKKECG